MLLMIAEVAQSAPRILVSSYLVPDWNSTTNRFTIGLDHLKTAGLLVEQSQAKITELRLDDFQTLWLVIDPARSNRFDADDVTRIETFVRGGGGLLIAIGATETQKQGEAIRPLLRRFHIAVNGRAVPAKVQRLTIPLLEGLRFYSPATPLLDLSEDAFRELILVPNNLKQTPLKTSQPDAPGLRIILGLMDRGHVALVAGDGSFDNVALSHSRDKTLPEHDNLEIFLRLVQWLSRARLTRPPTLLDEAAE